MVVHTNEPDCCFCFPISCGVSSIVIYQLIVVCDVLWQGIFWGVLKWNAFIITAGGVWLMLWLATRVYDTYAMRNILLWFFVIIITIALPIVNIAEYTKIINNKTHAEKACEVFDTQNDYCVTYFTIQNWILLFIFSVFNAYFSLVLKQYRDLKKQKMRYFGNQL